MSDLELFRYFRDRARSLDEDPTDALWEKIDARLGDAPKSGFSPKSLLKPLLFFAIAAGVFTSVIVSKSQTVSPDDDLPVVKPASYRKSTVRFHRPDSVNKKSEAPKRESVLYFAPNSPKIKEIELVVPEGENGRVNAASEKTSVSVSADSLKQGLLFAKPLPPSAETKVTGNRIVISTRAKLSKEAFAEMVASALKTELTSGQVLLVKAPGHKPFIKRYSDESENSFKAAPSLPGKEWTDDTITNKTPVYRGGSDRFNRFVETNFIVPDGAVSGRIWVSFQVEIDGSLSDFRIEKDPGGGSGEAVIKVLKTAPANWIPAKKDLKPVAARYMLTLFIKTE